MGLDSPGLMPHPK